MINACAACACRREADRAGRVVRWKNRKYIYRYACMVVRAAPTYKYSSLDAFSMHATDAMLQHSGVVTSGVENPDAIVNFNRE